MMVLNHCSLSLSILPTVVDHKPIFESIRVLDADKRYLSIRAFSPNHKREAYETKIGEVHNALLRGGSHVSPSDCARKFNPGI